MEWCGVTAGNRPVLVIGASRGIGAAIVDLLAASGRPVISGRRRVTDDESINSKHETIAIDVEDEPSLVAAATNIHSRFGGVGGVIITAGATYDDRFDPAASKGPLDQIDSAAMHRVFDVNAVGPLRAIRHLAPINSGTTLVLSSHRGSLTLTDGGGSISYAMSKAALNMLLRKAAFLLPRARIIGVHPGWVATDLGGAEAPYTPQQAAEMIVALFDNTTPEMHGSFVDNNGNALPW